VNALERYNAVLESREADILPRLPILMQFAAEFIGSNYGDFASNCEVLVEANLCCIEAFGFEQVSSISDPYRETQGFGARIEYVKDGVPRCPEPPLATERDLNRLRKPDPRRSERMHDRIRAVEIFREKVGGEYSILGWAEGPASEAADLRTAANFLMDTADDPDYACALMDRCLEVAVDFARAQVVAGADTIGIGDAIASQLSPDWYAKHILPREKILFDAIREAGARTRLHICGNITRLLPQIAELGADIVDIDWMVDMAECRRILGPGVALAGNLDPSAAVLSGTPDTITNAIRKIYEEVGNPYMPMAGCEVPAGTPPENLKALCAPVAWRLNP
jgi:MtaA/CmuA family methyltransferase